MNAQFYESILDTLAAVLVVDQDDRILYANEPWYRLVNVEPIAPGTYITPQLRASWKSYLRDPTGFDARLQQLRSDPEVEAHDLLEFTDGRLIERFSKPVPNDVYTNVRIWVFRDFADRLAMHDALPSLALSHSGANRIAERIATLEYDLARATVLRAQAGIANMQKIGWLDALLATAHAGLAELLSDQPRGAGSLDAAEIRSRASAALDAALQHRVALSFDDLCSIADVTSVPVLSTRAFLDGFVPALCAHALTLNGADAQPPATVRLLIAGGSIVIESVGSAEPDAERQRVVPQFSSAKRPKLRIVAELESIFASLSGFHRAETRTAREWIRYEHD